jgi:hypothetical protein
MCDSGVCVCVCERYVHMNVGGWVGACVGCVRVKEC